MISFQEATSLVEAAIQAEGGGWGVHVSAGIKGMMKKAVSSSATSFVLGDTRQVQKRTIRNKNARNLSPAARQLLQEDPEEFVRQHGCRYASSITLGGTFGGALLASTKILQMWRAVLRPLPRLALKMYLDFQAHLKAHSRRLGRRAAV